MSRALADLGDTQEMSDESNEYSSTQESATIRAGIKQKRLPGQEPPAAPKELIRDIHQRAEMPERANMPKVTGPAKKPGLKHAVIGVSAISGIAAIAAAMYFSGALGTGSSKPQRQSSSNVTGIAETPPAGGNSGISGINKTSGTSGAITATAASAARSGRIPPAGAGGTDSYQKPSQTSDAVSGGRTPAKTLGIGEKIGSLAGAAVHEASQAKEKQNISSMVDKGLAFVTEAISGADNVTYRPPQPPWPQGVSAARQDVRVQVRVGTDGLPNSPRVLGSPPYAFHAPAMDYAMRHKFRQRTNSSGSPMTYSHTIVAQFRPTAD